jgi:hypothetical protein
MGVEAQSGNGQSGFTVPSGSGPRFAPHGTSCSTARQAAKRLSVGPSPERVSTLSTPFRSPWRSGTPRQNPAARAALAWLRAAGECVPPFHRVNGNTTSCPSHFFASSFSLPSTARRLLSPTLPLLCFHQRGLVGLPFPSSLLLPFFRLFSPAQQLPDANGTSPSSSAG